MKPALLPDWRTIVRRAWSIKLMLLAGLLSGLEVILPMLGDSLPWSRTTGAAVTGLIVAAAFVTRLLAQPEKD